MLKELLGKDKEIILTASIELLNSLNQLPSIDDNALLIFYSLEDKDYSTVPCVMCDIIKESIDSEYYAHRQYIIVKLLKDEEAKLLVLINLGMDMLEAIVSFIKEEDIKWFNYEE